MLHVGPTFCWRLTTGLLSLLIVLAAEKKACPTLLAPSPSPDQPSGSESSTGDRSRPVSDDKSQHEKKKHPPVQIGVTIPDGLVPRALDQSAELSAARAALASRQLVADGSPNPPAKPTPASVVHVPQFVWLGAQLCRAETTPTLPISTLLTHTHCVEWLIGQCISTTGPPTA